MLVASFEVVARVDTPYLNLHCEDESCTHLHICAHEPHNEPQRREKLKDACFFCLSIPTRPVQVSLTHHEGFHFLFVLQMRPRPLSVCVCVCEGLSMIGQAQQVYYQGVFELQLTFRLVLSRTDSYCNGDNKQNFNSEIICFQPQ